MGQKKQSIQLNSVYMLRTHAPNWVPQPKVGQAPFSPPPTMALGTAAVCNFSWEEMLVIGEEGEEHTHNYSFCQDMKLKPVI